MDSSVSEPQKGCIELLAFISMVKNAHSNSVLYKTAAYKMAQKIGISDGRIVENYLSQCIAMSLCTVEEQRFNTKGRRTVYKFISYSKALSILLGIEKAQLKYFPLHKGLGKIKKYQYQIELDLAGKHFSQQAYKTASNFPNKHYLNKEMKNLWKLPVSERQTRRVKSKLKKLGKAYSAADDMSFQSKIHGHANGVVTGCNHIGALIGKSGTTGFKRLKKVG
ncbi:MAG TPA: hypothetical protein VFR58_17670 [Flavisolibacter sp.]|nr:hypothetical protein [Flavisolibacter sp.]